MSAFVLGEEVIKYGHRKPLCFANPARFPVMTEGGSVNNKKGNGPMDLRAAVAV